MIKASIHTMLSISMLLKSTRLPALIFLLIINTMALSVVAQEQEQLPLIALGDDIYRDGFSRDQVLEGNYLPVVKLYPDNIKANYMAGICYLQTTGKSKALPYFEKAYSLNPDFTPYFYEDGVEKRMPVSADLYPDLIFLLGYSNHINENFDAAINHYEKFKSQIQSGQVSEVTQSRMGKDGKGVLRDINRRIYECQVGKDMKSKASPANIRLVENINSEYPDYAPSVTQDGNTMVFTSRRMGGASDRVDKDLIFFEDIYIAERDADSVWQPATLVTSVSTEKHESSLQISADGQQMFLYKDDNGGDIYVSERGKGGEWTTPKPLGKTINTTYRESSAFMSPDGQLLFYASDRANGFGGSDIYVSRSLGKGKWGAPINMGPKINTEFDEDSPVLSFDGKTLYFSSKGHRGMGGYDIYVTKYDDINKEWSSPENLGYPINTSGNDTYYIVAPDEVSAYYASVKDKGVGDIDIYQILPLSEQADPEPIAALEAPEDTSSIDTLVLEEPVIASTETIEEEPEEVEVSSEEPQIEPVVTDNGIPVETTPLDNTNSLTGENPDEEPKVVTIEEPEQTINTLPTEPKEPENIETSSQDFITENTEQPADPIAPITKPVVAKPVAPTRPALKPTSITIVVKDEETGEPIMAQISLTPRKGGPKLTPQRIQNGEYKQTFTPDQAGQDYLLYIEKPGYLFVDKTIAIPSAQPTGASITKTYSLEKARIGRKIVLRNVYFDFNKATITRNSYNELQKIVTVMKENPAISVEIGGHTDYVGGDAYNLKLSQDRAQSVVNYLAAKGISRNRLTAKGYGETRPLASNDDEQEGRELNRRTEFEIIGE